MAKEIKEYDAVIVGAGPAGLSCAKVLAENGKKVLVLERNKEIGKKVCAGGITYNGLKLLGIPDRLFQKKFNSITVHTKLQDTKIKTGKKLIATICRKDLGEWQAKEAKKAGAEIKTNSEVISINEDFIILKNKEKFYYNYLVGADGANSIVRKYLGIKTENFLQAFQYVIPKKHNKLEMFCNIEKFGAMYLWIFPYKNSISIGTGWDSSRKIKQPVLDISHEEIRKNFDEFCKNKFNMNKAEFQSSIINYDYKGHEFKNKFLIGDAGGFASGLTGEGIYFAIKSGEDTANKILDKTYEYKAIPRILEIKKLQETILRSTEINKEMSEIESEIMNLILKIKLFDEELLNSLE